jgi:hypothetical protein
MGFFDPFRVEQSNRTEDAKHAKERAGRKRKPGLERRRFARLQAQGKEIEISCWAMRDWHSDPGVTLKHSEYFAPFAFLCVLCSLCVFSSV